MPATYPLDLAGINPANIISDELHTVSEAHYRDYFFLVPNFAPFYVDNFSMSLTVGNNVIPLVEDVHFSFALPYITGTRTTGKVMYGAMTLHNLDMTGILKITYRTIGGEHIADRNYVLSYLAEKAYNPRTTIWDLVTNVPNALPPVPHYQDYDQFYGQNEVVAKLVEIRDAILDNSSVTAESLNLFLQSLNIPGIANFLEKTGGILTGYLTLHSNPQEPMHASTRKYVDDTIATALVNIATAAYVNSQLDTKVNKTGDTLTGHLVLHDNPLVNYHPATKLYVDLLGNDLRSQINAITNSYALKSYVDQKDQELRTYMEEVLARMGTLK